MPTERELDIVFGEDSRGDTPEERARTSNRLWVRSISQFGEYKPTATGLVLDAKESLEVFGFDALLEVYYKGSFLLQRDPKEPAISLFLRRTQLDLSREELARRANLDVSQIINAEKPGFPTPMNVLVAISRVLGFDPRSIGFSP